MQKRTIIAAIILLFLSACTAANPLQGLLQTPEPTMDGTQVFESALLTVTWGVPTRTPTVTFTPTPTVTAPSTATPTPAPTEQPKVISKDNVRDLNVTRQIGPGRVMDLAFSPDGSHLLVLSANHLGLYDTATGRQLWKVTCGMIYVQASFTPDGGKILTMATGGGIQEWDATNGERGAHLSDIQVNIGLNTLSGSANRMLLSDISGKATLFDTQGMHTVASLGRTDITYSLEDAALNSSGSQVFLFGHHGPSEPLAMMFSDQSQNYYSLTGISGREFDFTFSGDDSLLPR